MNLSLFSFFSGVGFLDLGFEDEGYEIAYVNEVYEPFLAGYRYARELSGVCEPRFGYALASIEDSLGPGPLKTMRHQMRELRAEGSTVGFIGGPPCPDFSVGGKNRGKHGENGRLSRSYVDLILKTQPDFFLFENVKGLWRTSRHREFYEELKRDLAIGGYLLDERLINAIEYGAPQDRERIILIGVSRGAAESPLGVNWEDFTQFEAGTTLALPWPEAQPPSVRREKPRGIQESLTVKHWFDRNDVVGHPNAVHGFRPRAGLARFESVYEGDDSRKSYKRLHRWRYSPTAAYGNNEVHVHPWEARRITAAEALAVQSVPKTFCLPDSMTLSAMFKAIGNGVPYLAARGLARTLRATLSE